MAVDLTDPAFLRDPRPGLDRLAAEGPLVRARLPILGRVWLATDDATCRAVLKAPETFVRDPAHAGGPSLRRVFWWLPPFIRPLLNNPSQMDGADHRRLRGLVGHAFARAEIEDLRPELTRIADDLLDRITGQDRADLVSAYARPLPVRAICLLLGLREQDHARAARDSAPLGRITGFGSFVRALPGLRRLTRFFRAEIARQRREGGDGLIRGMIEAEAEDARRMTDDEILGMSVGLFVAGHETTSALISSSARELMIRPEVAQALREDPAAMPIFVEEMMRWQSPVYLTNQLFVAEEVTLGGVTLAKGDKVVPLLIAANRDPARFDAPWTMEPARRPNAHLGFGHGPHVCLGIQLARIEAQVALSRLIGRFPQARIEGDPEALPLQRRIGLRGLAALPVRPGPAAATAGTAPSST